jgi:hypothetical protein
MKEIKRIAILTSKESWFVPYAKDCDIIMRISLHIGD